MWGQHLVLLQSAAHPYSLSPSVLFSLGRALSTSLAAAQVFGSFCVFCLAPSYCSSHVQTQDQARAVFSQKCFCQAYREIEFVSYRYVHIKYKTGLSS